MYKYDFWGDNTLIYLFIAGFHADVFVRIRIFIILLTIAHRENNKVLTNLTIIVRAWSGLK